MNQIIEIEDALNQINEAKFQDFCNHYLYYKLNPNSIAPVGSVIGKEKTKKGIPDCCFTTKNGDFIYAEYTTKEKLENNKSFIEKLKSDIENCFNQAKTKIEPHKIKRVILCFTSNLKPNESSELNSLCTKYNRWCTLELIGIRDLSFAVLHYPLLGDYIGIKISTGQILRPSDFISYYEKSKFTTPLSNSFFGRKDELNEGLKKLEEQDIIIISGSPGTGKSKYAIELCRLYSDSNNDTEFLCIGNKDLAIWEDLQKYIRIDKNYILLVDDANRIAQNYRWILDFLNSSQHKKLKIVVTVRDYALTQIKEITSKYNYATIELKEFTNDEIKTILRSKDFNMREPADIDRVLKISRGNARLAIMSAKVAINTNNIQFFTDAAQIYNEYYYPLFEDFNILKETNTLKSLAIISFFGKIDKDDREKCNKIFFNLGLTESQFWEICYFLNENEILDLFEQQLVKISDQIFSTYIFYKTVFELKILDFSFFLNNFLDYEYRIKDTIIPILNTFNYKNVEASLKPTIKSKWYEINNSNDYRKSLKFLDLFWNFLPSEILAFLKKNINNQIEPVEKNYIYAYEANDFHSGASLDIEILARFKLLDPEIFKDALELLFYYAIRIPNKMPSLIYIIKEKFSFTWLGYRYGDFNQHTLIDSLIDKAEKSTEKTIFENILIEIIPNFLKIEYYDGEADGRKIIIHPFHIWLSDSIKSFRKKCFDYLDRKGEENKSILYQTIFNLKVFDYKDSIDIYEYDKKFIFPLIKKYFNPNEFEDCFVFQNFIQDLEFIGLEYPEDLKLTFNNQLFRLTEILKYDKKRKKELSYEEEEKLHRDELIEYCKDFQFSDYIKLLENVSIIINKIKKSHLEWQYINSLEIIISDLAEINYKLFIKIIKENLIGFHLGLNYNFLFRQYFKFNPKSYFKLFSTIKNQEIRIKLAYHQAINCKTVTSKHLKLLYDDFIATIESIEESYYFHDLTFISKYVSENKESIVYQDVFGIIIEKIKNEGAKISFGHNFIEKSLELNGFPFKKTLEAYLYTNKFEQHFDHNKQLLKKLIQRDNKVLFELLNFNLPEKVSYHDLEHENFDFIWELDNHNLIAKLLIDFFLENTAYLFWERAVNAFFPKNRNKYDNKPVLFLEEMIMNHFNNSNYMKVVFNIICYTFPGQRDELLIKFLSLNSDCNLFRDLELVRQGGVYMGSRIPHIENDKISWQRVLSVLDSMPNRLDFIEHKEFVNKQIGQCEMDIKWELKRDFIEDFR